MSIELSETLILATQMKEELPGKTIKSYHLMNRALVRALLAGEKPPVSGDEYLHVVEILEAAYRSKKEGRKIVLSASHRGESA